MEESIEIIKRAQSGDDDAVDLLLTKYKFLVLKLVRKYFLIGGDKEDLVQEGMIGLFKAIKAYDQTKSDNLLLFCKTLIERQIINAIKSSKMQKNQPLNEYIALNNQGGIVGQNEDEEKIFVLPESSVKTPENLFLSNYNVQEILKQIKTVLSNFELNVLELYLDGLNYLDIAKKLNKESKSIDNALNRIKSKLKFLNSK